MGSVYMFLEGDEQVLDLISQGSNQLERAGSVPATVALVQPDRQGSITTKQSTSVRGNSIIDTDLTTINYTTQSRLRRQPVVGQTTTLAVKERDLDGRLGNVAILTSHDDSGAPGLLKYEVEASVPTSSGRRKRTRSSKAAVAIARQLLSQGA